MGKSRNDHRSKGSLEVLCPTAQAAAIFSWLNCSCGLGTGKLMLLTEREQGFWNKHVLSALWTLHPLFSPWGNRQGEGFFILQCCVLCVFHARKPKKQQANRDLLKIQKKKKGRNRFVWLRRQKQYCISFFFLTDLSFQKAKMMFYWFLISPEMEAEIFREKRK